MSDLAVIFGGLLALIIGIVGYGQVQKGAGRKEAEDEAEKADTERALDIRARADRSDERLRRFDDAGFRD